MPKKKIHPKYYKVKVSCACGNQFETGSTLPDAISVEICSKCHPFWTGDEKLIDIEGRVDKFKRKQDIADKNRKKKIKEIKEKIAREKARSEQPQSLKDMLKAIQ